MYGSGDLSGTRLFPWASGFSGVSAKDSARVGRHPSLCAVPAASLSVLPQSPHPCPSATALCPSAQDQGSLSPPPNLPV